MRLSKKARANLARDILIFFLTLSAFWQLYLLVRPAGSSAVHRQSAALSSQSIASLTDAAAPLRLAVTGVYGRCGELNLTTAADAFAQPGALLREALGSAGDLKTCGEADFRAALAAVSVYYDFEVSLPLTVLSGFVGAEAPAELPVRRLLLAAGEEGAELYLTEGDSVYRCSTKVTAGSLKNLTDSFQTGGAAFAFELDEDTLDPYTLLLTAELPDYPVLSVRNSGDAASLLSALNFNPGTKARYEESDGTQVIGEGDRTMRLSPDGSLDYDSGGDDTITISAAGERPTAQEAALGGFQLLYRMVPAGMLALQSVESSGEGNWVVSFDYQADGVPVRLSGGSRAARVELQGCRVAGLHLTLRQYTPKQESSLLLPLTQALAIARPYTGRELNLCYVDGGGDTASAGWLAE